MILFKVASAVIVVLVGVTILFYILGDDDDGCTYDFKTCVIKGAMRFIGVVGFLVIGMGFIFAFSLSILYLISLFI